MIDFNKEDNQRKISLNTDIRDLGAKPKTNEVFVANINSESDKDIIEEEKAFRRGVLSVRDLISPASLKAEAKHLVLGNKFVRTIFVIGYPRYISVGWFAPIINLNLTFDVSMFFYPVKFLQIFFYMFGNALFITQIFCCFPFFNSIHIY